MAILTDADQRLRDWLGPVAGGVPVLAELPGDDAAEAGITAVLLGLESTATLAGALHRPAPLVLRLRYLVCPHAPEPRRALELLEAVVTAALDTPVVGGQRMEVDLTPIAPETWVALGARQRPAITLRVDARHARAPDEVPVVLEPLRLVGATIRSLTGHVLGPGDVPLTGAEVTLRATGAAERTTATGAFTFDAVPAGAPVQLAVRAKGRFFVADVDPDGDEPVVVRCDPLEG